MGCMLIGCSKAQTDATISSSSTKTTLTTSPTTTNSTVPTSQTTSTNPQVTTSTPTSITTSTVPTSPTTLTTTPTLPEVSLPYPEVPRITAEELKNLMDQGKSLILVDTRPSGSYADGHIKGAINIPDSMGPTLIEDELMSLPFDTLIVFYCD
jgi:hypothetical protein